MLHMWIQMLYRRLRRPGLCTTEFLHMLSFYFLIFYGICFCYKSGQLGQFQFLGERSSWCCYCKPSDRSPQTKNSLQIQRHMNIPLVRWVHPKIIHSENVLDRYSSRTSHSGNCYFIKKEASELIHWNRYRMTSNAVPMVLVTRLSPDPGWYIHLPWCIVTYLPFWMVW